jgi:hypothetical protein
MWIVRFFVSTFFLLSIVRFFSSVCVCVCVCGGWGLLFSFLLITSGMQSDWNARCAGGAGENTKKMSLAMGFGLVSRGLVLL